ncbi:MAG: luciferase-like monooxygenase [Chloroflexi bacterium]|nr:MAG: luciferase-like monooxygenase [Chloroflexota bacterium]
MSKLKWGLQSSPQHVSYCELLELWQKADSLGYDSAWLFDHFIPITGLRTGPCFEGWTLLSALAAQTTRLHVGCLVTSVIYRHPAVLAKMGATLDVITSGRLELGIGAGWFEAETLAFGMPFPRTGERLAQLDEALQVIRMLWTQDYSDFTGRHFTLTQARCEPKPLQKPTPTIWVGGQGEKVTLRIVAKRADGWDMDMLPLDVYDHKLEVLSGHCERAERDPATVQKTIHFAGVIAEDEHNAQKRAETLAQQWNTSVAELRGRVLVGTPQQAAEQLMTYVDRGVGHFVLSLAAPYDLKMVELYINEVAPLVERLMENR